jgi:hypothetical protein
MKTETKSMMLASAEAVAKRPQYLQFSLAEVRLVTSESRKLPRQKRLLRLRTTAAKSSWNHGYRRMPKPEDPPRQPPLRF